MALFSYFFKSISIIEHGEVNYVDIQGFKFYKKTLYGFVKKNIFRNNYIGESKIFKYVYLSLFHRCPTELKEKYKELSIKKLSKDMDLDEIKKINKLFNFKIDGSMRENKKYTLLLTQPFSELEIITESEKVDLYIKAVGLNKNNLIIKPHPKETTHYNLYFPYAKLTNKMLPVELFDLNKIHFAKVITVNSSGAKNLSADEIVYIRDERVAH